MAEGYKILLFMKRRAGMSVEDFRDYYENHHVPLVTKGAPSLGRYVRRYIEPLAHPDTGNW
jgi:EthD domain